MAEASVALLITKVAAALGAEALSYASSLVQEEGLLLRQFHRKLKEIVAEFEVMLAFLRQMDMHGDETGVENAWAEQVREAALEVENIIDEYTYLLGSHHRRHFRDFLRKAFGRAPKSGSVPDVAQRLEDVESKLQHLSTIKERYGVRPVGGGPVSSRDAERWKQNIVDGSSHPAADGFVGMEKSKAALLGWLTADQGSCRKLISVWGMGGMGKTTLVNEVLKSQIVRDHFHIHPSITVSEAYTLEDLLRKMIRSCFGNKETMPDIDNMSHSNLVEMLNKRLDGKRYILTLDDVWSTNVWRDIKNTLTVGDYGSMVVLTTRKRDVASLGDNVLELKPLDENDAWVLFCKMAFSNERDTACPAHLEHHAKAILDKCQGLPLAIVALGSLLSLRDKEELEWKKVYDNLNWQLLNNPQLLQLKSILFVSFKELPGYLKHCLMYCSIFPEDFSITRKRLIRLWVAEGLVQSRGRLTMEEVAEDNLNELIYLGMLQVAKRNNFGRVQSCRMHDMIREVVLQISDREKFGNVHDSPEETLYTKARRLSIHKTPKVIEKNAPWISRLRSFLFFGESCSSTGSLFSTLSSAFKLLRVLDLQGAPIKTLPENVYHLFNLHYLSLRETGISKISDSLGNLYNLETLDLKDTGVTQLPRGITKLKKLRHLLVGVYSSLNMETYYSIVGLKVPKGLWKLKELQNIHYVEASDEFVRNVENLEKLRSLYITEVRAAQCAKLGIALSKMVQLRSLGIAAKEKDEEILDLGTLSSPYLQKLFLGGRLKNDVLPDWFCSLRNLKQLFLHWSRLRESPVPRLHESLPNLESLALSHAYVGNSMCFFSGWFPKLKSLFLVNMPLKQVVIQEGAMTKLENLSMWFCRQLEDVPSGVEHLADLRALELMGLAKELVHKLRTDRDTRRRVRSIPCIQHIYRTDDGWCLDDLKVSS